MKVSLLNTSQQQAFKVEFPDELLQTFVAGLTRNPTDDQQLVVANKLVSLSEQIFKLSEKLVFPHSNNLTIKLARLTTQRGWLVMLQDWLQRFDKTKTTKKSVDTSTGYAYSCGPCDTY